MSLREELRRVISRDLWENSQGMEYFMLVADAGEWWPREIDPGKPRAAGLSETFSTSETFIDEFISGLGA